MSNKIILSVIVLLFLAASAIYGFKASKNNSSDLKVRPTNASTGQIKKFNLTAKQWSFEPAEIIVNRGDNVFRGII